MDEYTDSKYLRELAMDYDRNEEPEDSERLRSIADRLEELIAAITKHRDTFHDEPLLDDRQLWEALDTHS